MKAAAEPEDVAIYIKRMPADLDRILEFVKVRHGKTKTDLVIEALEAHPLIQAERKLQPSAKRAG